MDDDEVNTFPTSHMSLFPAYKPNDLQLNSDDNTDKQQSEGLEWLTNASFQIQSNVFQNQLHQDVPQIKDDRLIGNDELVVDVKDHGKHHLKKKKVKVKKLKKQVTPEPRSVSKKDAEESDESSLYGVLSKKVFIEDTGLALERAYRVDKKPDRNNMAFKTFYHQHIAKYFQKQSPPLGVSSYAERLWHLQQTKKKRKRDAQRYFSRESASSLQRTIISSISSKTNEELPRIQKVYDYLPLETTFAKSNSSVRSNSNPLGIYDSLTDLYLQGKGLEQPVAGSEVTLTPRQLEIQQKTQDFNRSLRENPSDENKWLEFVAFQDQVMGLDPYGDSKTVGKSRDTACLEKKLSILDRALDDNPQSARLAIERLKVCEGLWDLDKVSGEWKRLSFRHPNQPTVWQNYLLFVQSNLIFFTVTKASKVYIKCLRTLSNILEGTFQSHSPPPDLEERMLEIFYQYCHMLKESGYEERAMATFQALIELNLFTPTILSEDESLKEWQTVFEPFWDSGVARFGEEGAQGWSQVMSNMNEFSPRRSLNFSDLNSAEDEIIKKRLPGWGTWLQFELLRQSRQWLPWQPNVEKGEEEDSCEDPERMVVVDDVVGLMFRLRLEKSKFSLLLHFLRFLGMQTHPYLHSHCQNSACTNPATLSSLADILSTSTSAKTDEFYAMLTLPIVFFHEELFSFISKVLLQSQNCFSDDYRKRVALMWAQHSLDVAFSITQGNVKKLRSELKDLKKNMKKMLRDEPFSKCLHLWAFFGRLEWLLGNFSEAHRVFETTLTVRGSCNESQDVLFGFARNYANLLLGNDPYVSKANIENGCPSVDKGRIVWVLAYLGSGEQYSIFKGENVNPVTLMKARKGYESVATTLFKSISGRNGFLEQLIDCVSLFGFFLYFSQNVNAAKTIYERAITALEGEAKLSSTLEALFTSYLQLLSFHVFRHVVPLSEIRPTLERALLAFPSNHDFLQLFLQIEGGTYIAGRLRRLVGRIVTIYPNMNAIFWYYIVCGELRRLKALKKFAAEDSLDGIISETGTTWKVRSLFEMSIKSSQHCPVLWRLYMKFENDYGSPDRVKSVFYRALRNCPWTKVMYMDCLCYCPNELQEIIDLMGEKEIRIRTPLEEIELLIQHEKPRDDEQNSLVAEEAKDAS